MSAHVPSVGRSSVARGVDAGFFVESPRGEPRTVVADDLKEILDVLRRRAAVFWLAFGSVFIAALCWLYSATPLYTANATVVLDPRRPLVTNTPEVLSEVEFDSAVTDTQVQLIRSRVILGAALGKLIAAGDLRAPEGGGANGAAPTRDDLIARLARNLDVARIGLTYAIRVAYTDEDPGYAAAVANAVTSAYLEHQLNVRQRATREANQWLNRQVADLREQVEAAEAAVEEYRSNAGLLTARGTTSTENQQINIDIALTEARRNLSDAEARLNGYRRALADFEPVDGTSVVVSPMMEQLRREYSALINQRAQLSPALGSMHPRMIELERQIGALRSQMTAEVERVIDEASSDVAIAESQVEGLVAIRDEARRQLAQDNAANVELAQLQTNAESLRLLYEGMLSRLKQTTAQETLGRLDATVVSDAVPPDEPSSPRVDVVLAGALGLGIAFGAFAVLLAQLLDKSVVKPAELEARTGKRVLALVPKIERADRTAHGPAGGPADVVAARPQSLFTEAFRNLRIAVLNDPPTIVQLTSGSFAEGKTVSSIAFARTAAMEGRRVLLVDGDLRRRTLTKTLGISARCGLLELLKGDVRLDDAVLPPRTVRRDPDVLPLSDAGAKPTDVLVGDALERVLPELRARYDLVVVDSAPVLAVADSLALASRVDVVVLVAKWAETPLPLLNEAIEQVERAGGRVAGTLLTHVDIKALTSRSYGRGYYPALLRYYQP